ncbi:uncharacterized protein LOC135483131 [Lineus longissimus]|uniref:uncharacterized protein LOC135483131 n=1 Tax=Lineus longissimus TaxID=88925 RepID=UPI002B4C7D84
MMLTAFFLISLTLNAVNGIEMCAGSYELPEIVDVTTTPVYQYRNVINEVDVSMAVRSRSPVYMSWFLIGTKSPRQITEDDENSRVSVSASGDRYIFKLHTKLEKTVLNVSEILGDFYLSLQVIYDCNSVGLGMNLRKWIEVAHAGLTLPKITLLPRGRYVIDGYGLKTPEIKLRFSRGPDERPPKVQLHCLKYLERRNGDLQAVYYRIGGKKFETNSKKLDDLGVTEATCEVNVGGGFESYYVSLSASIELQSPIESRRYDFDSLHLQLVTEFRRSGISKPAVMVSSRFNYGIERKGDVLLIPTDANTTSVICFADAASKPMIAAGRLKKGGGYQPLKKIRNQNGIYFVSLNTATFSLKSPRLLEEEDYICSASTGQAIASQKFRLLRFNSVQVTSNRTDSMPLEVIENKQYSLSCEATGIPQPDITFYWSPTPTRYPFDVKQYQKFNKDHEIHNSDVFDTTTSVEGTTTYGGIIVKDMNKTIASLPSNFWDDNYIYEVVCFASNEYSYRVMNLGYFYKPSDWDSNHPVNATRFSLFK